MHFNDDLDRIYRFTHHYFQLQKLAWWYFQINLRYFTSFRPKPFYSNCFIETISDSKKYTTCFVPKDIE